MTPGNCPASAYQSISIDIHREIFFSESEDLIKGTHHAEKKTCSVEPALVLHSSITHESDAPANHDS